MIFSKTDPTKGSRTARRRRLIAGLATVVACLAAFVLWYFQPQAALLNHRIDETLPAAAGAAAPNRAPAGDQADLPVVSGPTTLLRGSLQSLEHPSSGRALVLQLTDGSRHLRLEDLQTSSGPDVHVVLSPVPAGTDDRAYSEGYLELGGLQGNQGNQNYAIPAGTDLSRYRSAVIYCRRFSVGFAVAGLS
ncbi:MAG: DM13 domain-containing protein [Candidatus Dormibacteria bacterium]